MTQQQRQTILHICFPLQLDEHSLNVLCQEMWQVQYDTISRAQADDLIEILQNLTIAD